MSFIPGESDTAESDSAVLLTPRSFHSLSFVWQCGVRAFLSWPLNTLKGYSHNKSITRIWENICILSLISISVYNNNKKSCSNKFFFYIYLTCLSMLLKYMLMTLRTELKIYTNISEKLKPYSKMLAMSMRSPDVLVALGRQLRLRGC